MWLLYSSILILCIKRKEMKGSGGHEQGYLAATEAYTAVIWTLTLLTYVQNANGEIELLHIWLTGTKPNCCDCIPGSSSPLIKLIWHSFHICNLLQQKHELVLTVRYCYSLSGRAEK